MKEAPNYVALAIPIFFLLIGLELLFMRLSRTKIYRFNDALTNISCGIGSQVMGAFTRTVLILGYIWLYENARQFTIPFDTWWSWVVLFVGVDFFYYWFHRYSHEISFLWGAHIVHHQSEEYNLSVALRQSAFQTFFSSVFYLPLAIIGFDPVQFIVVNQLQTLYQFWIHTQAIGKMPWIFELIFNTPSHHRVHHGIQPKYIDRNHGGTLIIFDRIFGTFQKEEEEVVYGVTKSLASWNPIWANFDYYADLLKLARKCRNPLDVIRLFIKGPGWRPAYMGGPQHSLEISPQEFNKFDTTIPQGLNYYILFQYVVLLGGSSLFLFNLKMMPSLWLYGMGGLILLSILSLGAVLEGKRWGSMLEYMRLALAAAAIPAFLLEMGHPSVTVMAISGMGIYAISAIWLSQYRKWFRLKEESQNAEDLNSIHIS